MLKAHFYLLGLEMEAERLTLYTSINIATSFVYAQGAHHVDSLLESLPA